MRAYRERLSAPATWWLWSTACVVLLGSLLWAGFSILIGLAVYAVLEAGCAVLLTTWGSTRIEVTETELVAGSRRIALGEIGEVAALDAEQTRALRGPRADPAAFLIVRPYLPKSVYVEIVGRPASGPYWLIGTRRPEQLAEAIERARPRPAGEPPCDDDAPGARLEPDIGSMRADAAAHGREGNAW